MTFPQQKSDKYHGFFLFLLAHGARPPRLGINHQVGRWAASNKSANGRVYLSLKVSKTALRHPAISITVSRLKSTKEAVSHVFDLTLQVTLYKRLFYLMIPKTMNDQTYLSTTTTFTGLKGTCTVLFPIGLFCTFVAFLPFYTLYEATNIRDITIFYTSLYL